MIVLVIIVSENEKAKRISRMYHLHFVLQKKKIDSLKCLWYVADNVFAKHTVVHTMSFSPLTGNHYTYHHS